MHDAKTLSSKRAFTLIEMLIVIGLVTLIATWVIFNQTAAGISFTQLNPQEALIAAIKEARYQSQIKGEAVSLTWDLEKQHFDIRSNGQNIELEEPAAYNERLSTVARLEIWFRPKLATEKSRSFELDEVIEYGEATPLKLTFSPHAVGSSGQIEFRSENQQATFLSLEPFSHGAPISR